jgi:hypothetical protein
MVNAGIEPVVFAFDGVPEYIDKGFHVGILFDVSKKLEQKETDRIISKADGAIPVGNDGSDERKIDQGGYESRQSADDAPVGFDFDITALVGIFG